MSRKMTTRGCRRRHDCEAGAGRPGVDRTG
jgi:hypothetical protein